MKIAVTARMQVILFNRRIETVKRLSAYKLSEMSSTEAILESSHSELKNDVNIMGLHQKSLPGNFCDIFAEKATPRFQRRGWEKGRQSRMTVYAVYNGYI